MVRKRPLQEQIRRMNSVGRNTNKGLGSPASEQQCPGKLGAASCLGLGHVSMCELITLSPESRLLMLTSLKHSV